MTDWFVFKLVGVVAVTLISVFFTVMYVTSLTFADFDEEMLRDIKKEYELTCNEIQDYYDTWDNKWGLYYKYPQTIQYLKDQAKLKGCVLLG